MATAPTLTCPLNGISLIEAAAGTGKTYNIQNLVARMILESPWTIDQLVVVSFTEAAAAELKDRIRRILLQLQAEIQHPGTIDEDRIRQLLEQARSQGTTDAEAAAKLHAALTDFDLAAIGTIHSFCRRLLSDCAFDSCQSFSAVPTGDQRKLMAPFVRDCYRQHLYRGADAELLRNLMIACESFKFKQLLETDSGGRDVVFLPHGRCASLTEALAALRQQAENLRSHFWPDPFALLYGKFKGNSIYKRAKLDADTEKLTGLTLADQLLKPETLTLLFNYHPNRIAEKARQAKSGDVSWLNELADDPVFSGIAKLKDAVEECLIQLTQSSRAYLKKAFSAYCRQQNLITFDELLIRARDALRQNPELPGKLRGKFKAGIIDEFQDTDPVQYEIFRTLFGVDADSALFMVGDPRQAIYRFRGGDIHTYVKASAQVPPERRYTLAVNFRSTGKLIAAVNQMFGEHPSAFATAAFKLPQLSEPENPGQRHLPLRLNQAEDPTPLTFLPLAPESDVELLTARRILYLLTCAQTEIFDPNEKKYRPVRPDDFAILCRKWSEAVKLSCQLRALNIPAMTLKCGNVFHTDEARDLLTFLHGVFAPYRTDRAVDAVFTPLVGAAPEERPFHPDRYQAELSELNQIWLNQSFGEMFNAALNRFNTRQRYPLLPDGDRRLSDLLQLGDLLQAESQKSHLSPIGAIQFLTEQLTDQSSGSELYPQQLASEAAAVKILTMHSSKGLEFPIVLLPYLNAMKSTVPKNEALLPLPQKDQQSVCEIFPSEAFMQCQRNENLQEHLRLAYVAVTRAIYHCEVLVKTEPGGSDTPLDWLYKMRNGNAVTDDPQNMLQQLSKELLPEYPPEWLQSQAWESVPLACYQPDESQAERISARVFHAEQLDTDWKYTSFSALAAGNAAPVSLLAETLQELDDETAAPTAERSDAAAPDSVLKLGGTAFGSAIHKVLENLDFSSDSAAIKVMLEYELGHLDPAPEEIDFCANMIQQALHAELVNKHRLCEVPKSARQSEIPFQYQFRNGFSIAELQENVNRYAGYTAERSNGRISGGALTGAIDLVFELDGRYFIADWKTNRLPSYRPQALKDAVCAHQYHLQYLIYVLALTKIMRLRFGKMDEALYEQKFGGVYYFFLRGMSARCPQDGIFFDRPEYAEIQQLDRIIG